MKILFLILSLVSNFAWSAKPKTYIVKPTRGIHLKGFHKKPYVGQRHLRTFGAVQIPDQFNLAPKVSPIRNQGACGSCYAFGPSSVLRDDLMLMGKDPGVLSPQYLMDYSGGGCSGGTMDVMNWATSPRGVPSESSYPYIGQDEGKRFYRSAASAASWQMLGSDVGVTPQDIEAYMVQYNATVVVTMAAGAGDFESYGGGVYNGCAFGDEDHIVRIVGWDNHGQPFNGNGYLANGTGDWLVANQWGEEWGAGGYFRIQMTDDNGVKCNNIAAEAAGFFFKKIPGGKKSYPGLRGSSKK